MKKQKAVKRFGTPNTLHQRLLLLGRRSLGKDAVLLYLWLNEMGPTGLYPGSREMEQLMGTTAGSATRDEEILVAQGLVLFRPTMVNRQIYTLVGVPANSCEETQLDAWNQLFSNAFDVQSAIVPEPVISKPPVLTAESRTWFLQSADRMTLYLRYGAGAFGKTAEEAVLLPSQPNDWLKHQPANPLMPYDKSWTANQFIAYFWDGVCRWRDAHHVALSFPNWGRLAKAFDILLKSCTHGATFRHTWRVINDFDLICAMMGNAGIGMALNEGTISHALVAQQIQACERHGEDWTMAQRHRVAAGQPIARVNISPTQDQSNDSGDDNGEED